jgi:plastocyanin
MRARVLLTGLLVAAATLGITATVPAQAPQRKIIEITTTSYKYEPNQVRFNEGDTVVIRMRNIDPVGRAHNFSTAYLLNIPVTVRGDATQGTSEGRKWIAIDAGKSAEFEFVAHGRGSFAILCSLFDHASRGHTGALFVQPAGSP